MRDLLETTIVSSPVIEEDEDLSIEEQEWHDLSVALSEWVPLDIDALTEAKKKSPPSDADISKARGLVKKATDEARKFVRSMDNLMSAASELATQAKKDASRVKRDGKQLGARRSKFRKYVNRLDKEVRKVYGHFAEGRNSMNAAAKLMGVSTRRSRAGKPRGRSIPAGDIASTQLSYDIARISKAMVPALRRTAEDGAAALRMGEALHARMGREPLEAWHGDFEAWVQRWLDFRDGVSSSVYKPMGAVVKRAKEMGRRIWDGTESVDMPKDVVEALADTPFPWESDLGEEDREAA